MKKDKKQWERGFMWGVIITLVCTFVGIIMAFL